MANFKNQFAQSVTNDSYTIPDGHTCGHITAVDGDVVLTFNNGDIYTIADGETFPIWHIGEPYYGITITVGAGITAKASWIMA